MSYLLKTCAIALTAALTVQLLRQRTPELAMLLSICAVLLIQMGALPFVSALRELVDSVKTIADGSEVAILPVLKCVVIAVLTKFCADLCRDAAQSAAASSVEFAGTVCAMGVGMPLMLSMLKMIGGLI